MSLKQTDQQLMKFYLECLIHEKEDRRMLAKKHGIPCTKARTAYHRGCDVMYKKLDNAKNINSGHNFGKGGL